MSDAAYALGGKVAVLGSGVSGLTAAYLLQRRYAVTLYEADDRLGGHAHTHDVATGGGTQVPVDTGFIVHNQRTYPHLVRLFDELGVETRPTEMSMSVRCTGCGLEYAGARGPRGLFAQRRNAVNPRYLGMLTEIKRFHRAARVVLAESPLDDPRTLRQFLESHRFSQYFVAHFVIPLVSTVWSTGTHDALGYPAAYLFTFLDNHGMLAVSGSPRWHTVAGGSRTYVERVVKGIPTRTASPVRAVQRHEDGVDVRTDADDCETFDHVVIATHADQALTMLTAPTPAERAALGAFRFTRNDAVLHRDTALLPRSSAARASWNYTARTCGDPGTPGARVTYDLSRLQLLAEARHEPILLSLGMADRIDDSRVLTRFSYEHPVYTPESLAAQRRLSGLTSHRVRFAGAWLGWGFHEDGCVSGVRAAAALGVSW